MQGGVAQTWMPGCGPRSDCPSSGAELRRVDGFRSWDFRAKRSSAFTGFRVLFGRWAGGMATRIPGGLQAHAGRLEQPATPETNIGLAAKEDSGWRIEDGKNRLGAGCCARTRNLARNARVFDSALWQRRKAECRTRSQQRRAGKATPSHPRATHAFEIRARLAGGNWF